MAHSTNGMWTLMQKDNILISKEKDMDQVKIGKFIAERKKKKKKLEQVVN